MTKSVSCQLRPAPPPLSAAWQPTCLPMGRGDGAEEAGLFLLAPRPPPRKHRAQARGARKVKVRGAVSDRELDGNLSALKVPDEPNEFALPARGHAALSAAYPGLAGRISTTCTCVTSEAFQLSS